MKTSVSYSLVAEIHHTLDLQNTIPKSLHNVRQQTPFCIDHAQSTTDANTT